MSDLKLESMSDNSKRKNVQELGNLQKDEVIVLPRKMIPSRAAFETLGFKFTDINDSVLVDAILPDGWSIQPKENRWNDLVDDKGRIRGSYYYCSKFYDRSGLMELNCRYCRTSKYIDPNDFRSPVNVVVTDACKNDAIIFNAGQCQKIESDEWHRLREIAESYLNSNWPEWEDPEKYWD
jgi:hypothetical protein